MTSDDHSGDWIHLTIEVPPGDGMALLIILKEMMNFAEVDWCELQRPDFARVSWGPCPPRTESGYTIPPFPQGFTIEDLSDRPIYVCPHCGARSASAEDFRNEYCGRCHQFASTIIEREEPSDDGS